MVVLKGDPIDKSDALTDALQPKLLTRRLWGVLAFLALGFSTSNGIADSETFGTILASCRRLDNLPLTLGRGPRDVAFESTLDFRCWKVSSERADACSVLTLCRSR